MTASVIVGAIGLGLMVWHPLGIAIRRLCDRWRPERPAGRDVQRCPSCGSTGVLGVSVEGGRVWLACACDSRWSIADRRSSSATRYAGP